MDARTGDQLAQSSDVAITPDAHAQTDQATWDFWVEVPRGANRRFYVELQLYDNQGTVPIGRLRTATFGPSR